MIIYLCQISFNKTYVSVPTMGVQLTYYCGARSSSSLFFKQFVNVCHPSENENIQVAVALHKTA